MRKHFLLPFLLFLLTGTLANAQQPDSIYFYKDGAIVYGEGVTQIDSLTFHATNYYDLQRSEAIYNELASHPELSIFTWMILSAGMQNELINKTIWAPTNESFQGMDPKDLLDLNIVRRILNNQMCKCQITTAILSTGPRIILMNSGKKLTFSKTETGYDMAGNTLLKSDLRVASSVIHMVGGKNPYQLNLWEYIDEVVGMDSLRSYIRSINTPKLYRNIFINNVFKDTITLVNNDMLEYLAKVDKEDSIYTVLLPDNEAFMEAYNRLLPYCKSPSGIPDQSDAAKWSILKELIFMGKLATPLTNDSIYSVSGTKYLHPDSLFQHVTSTVSLSNGLAYRVNHLKAFEPGFQKRKILIEAEEKLKNNIVAANYTMSAMVNTYPFLSVSNGKYLFCNPTSSSPLTPLTITVPLPNTYAMKYNLYFVFVPTIVTDTTDLRPYKLDFYISTNGDVANVQPTYTKINTSNIITNPTALTKVLVAENFEFQNCTILHNPNAVSKLQLRVRNVGGTTATELKNFNRSLRIDYILLEPVE